MDIIKTSDFFCEKEGCLGNGSGWSTSTCLYLFYCKQALQCMKKKENPTDKRTEISMCSPPRQQTGF